MVKPTIHMNGTSRGALADGYEVAGGALRRALETLQDAGPNARDYYPQGETAFPNARREHEDRIARVRAVLAEICELAEHVADAP